MITKSVLDELKKEVAEIPIETKIDEKYIDVNQFGVKYIKPKNAVLWFIEHLEKKLNA